VLTLAGWRDYLYLWQLPMVLAYFAAWLVGGPFLTRRALRRLTDLPSRRISLGRCAAMSLVASGAGAAAMAVTMGFFLALGRKVGPEWLEYIGLGVGPAAMLGVGAVIHSLFLNRPAGVVFRVTATTTGALVCLLMILGAGAFIPATMLRQAALKDTHCRVNLLRIHAALYRYAQIHPGELADGLEDLLADNLIEAKHLRCPAREDGHIGYLYARVPPARRNTLSQQIRACDRRGNHGKRRHVLFADGRVEVLTEQEFAAKLRLPENAGLAKIVAAEP